MTDSVAKQTSEVQYTGWWGSNYGASQDIPIAPGQRMRVYSPVGFWRSPGIPVDLKVTMSGPDPLVDVNVTNDGSILGFTIPLTAPVGSVQSIQVLSTTGARPRVGEHPGADQHGGLVHRAGDRAGGLSRLPTPAGNVRGLPFGVLVSAERGLW